MIKVLSRFFRQPASVTTSTQLEIKDDIFKEVFGIDLFNESPEEAQLRDRKEKIRQMEQAYELEKAERMIVRKFNALRNETP